MYYVRTKLFLPHHNGPLEKDLGPYMTYNEACHMGIEWANKQIDEYYGDWYVEEVG